MLEGWSRNIQVSTTDIINSLVINQEGAVRVFNCAVGAENRIVGLDNSGRDSWSGIHGKFKLGFLTIVGGKAFKEERTKARSGSTAEGVEDQKAL